MRILMIAPEPFFEPRGTPLSEYCRIKALIELGHGIDLVTYPFGEDVLLAGFRIFRCRRPPFVRRVRVGPSWTKVVLDLSLAATTLWRLWRGHYDAIHSHEEGGVLGVVLARLAGVPHVYDMHSSLPQQITNFDFTRSRIVRRVFAACERFMIRGSRAVVVICPQLAETAASLGARDRAVLIENSPGAAVDQSVVASEVDDLRRALGIPAAHTLVVYTGTFEPYQGLDLLFDAAARLAVSHPRSVFLLVGGDAAQLKTARAEATARGVADRVIFAGQRPPAEMPTFLALADVLVSPRKEGTNTPLKIYSYLRAGRPIVATRLLTHTQVLTPEVAVLTDPDGHAFAEGIRRVLDAPAFGAALGARARRLADEKYSYARYLEQTQQLCRLIGGDPAGTPRPYAASKPDRAGVPTQAP